MIQNRCLQLDQSALQLVHHALQNRICTFVNWSGRGVVMDDPFAEKVIFGRRPSSLNEVA